jgi:hypothetical protein
MRSRAFGVAHLPLNISGSSEKQNDIAFPIVN